MILSGHQPVYLPSIHLLNKIAISDAFMWVGHCQFSPRSWQQRNRINLNGRELLLSVPVKKAGKFGQSIDGTEIDGDAWKRKHLGSIRQAYQKAPFFDQYYPGLEFLIGQRFDRLGFLNRAIVSALLHWLDIKTPMLEAASFVRQVGTSSDGTKVCVPVVHSEKTQMLVEMCRAAKADAYLSNEGARAYVDEDLMGRYRLAHHWQEFEHPVYEQGRDVFVPNMSAIDLLFNVGPAAGEIVRNCGRVGPSNAERAA